MLMTKSNPFISICLPTYNRAFFLKESIKSVLEQKYSCSELIIINDGSSDNTEEVIKSFKGKRIRYLKNEKNLGYISSINKATAQVKGDWIMHLSDDDLLLPDALKLLAKAISENQNKQIGFVVPQTININSKGKVISIPKSQLDNKEYLILEPKEFIPNYTLYGKKIREKYRFNTCFPATLFNKKTFIKMGMSCPQLPVAHDLLIAAKICLKYPIIVIDKPSIKYRIHESWGSGLNQRGEFLEEYLRYLNLLFDFVKNEKIKFDYDFEKYCCHSLINYLFSLDGGLIRLAARYQGPYQERLKRISQYIRFGLSKEKNQFFRPAFYFSILASLLPQKLLLKIGQWQRKI